MDGKYWKEKGRGEPVVGIHLGVLECCVAVWNEASNRAEVIPDNDGRRITPTFISFPQSNQILVGHDAKDQFASNLEKTIYGATLLTRTKFSDMLMEDNLEIVEGHNGEGLIVVEYEGERKLYQPQLLLAILLAKLKDYAEKYLARPIKNAVFCVPPSKTESSQWKAMEDAATLVGLNVLRFISRPIAAAISYGMMQVKDNCTGQKRNAVIFDFSSEVIDVSIVEIQNSVVEIKATVVEEGIGGMDLASTLMDYIVERLRSKRGEEIEDDEETKHDGTEDDKQIEDGEETEHDGTEDDKEIEDREETEDDMETEQKEDSEETKDNKSIDSEDGDLGLKIWKVSDDVNRQFFAEKAFSVSVEIPAFHKGIDLSMTIMRSKFEEINAELFEQLMHPVKRCLEDAKMDKAEIDEVVLVGEYSRLVKVRQLLEEFFQRKVMVSDSMDLKEAFAVGAAIRGAMMVASDQEQQRGAKLSSRRTLNIKDVTLLSLGVESSCGMMDVIIQRGTLFDTRKNKKYTTCRDNQTTINFKVYEGEQPIAKDNHLLGHLQLTDIKPAPAGAPEVEVSFNVDKNGMFQATALDSNSGKKAAFTISERSGRISKENMDKMLREIERCESNVEEKIKKLLTYSVNLDEVDADGTTVKDGKYIGTVKDHADTGIEVPYGPVIGIDLGTSNSCVGVWDNNRVDIIIDNEGHRVIPSYVAFPEDDDVLFGEAAKSQMTQNIGSTIFGMKRLIGRKFDDKIVQEDINAWPFVVVEGKDNEPEIVVKYKKEEEEEEEEEKEEKHFSAQEILCIVLRNLKELAEKQLHQNPIKDVVVTVPVYFQQSQRMAITKVAEAAGLKIHRFVNEPTAAAVAYTYKYNSSQKKNVLVFDLGGGTLDVSLLEVQNSVVVVKATDGDSHLGGEDFDKRIINYFCKLFNEKHNVNIIHNKKSMSKLKKECEEAKKRLCVKNGKSSTRIEIESLYRGKDYSEILLLSKFEELNNDLFIKSMKPVERCLEKSRLKVNEVDEIILVGGSSRIPKIQELLQELFQGKELLNTLPLEEVVATGAAIIGAKLGRAEDESLIEFNLKDVTPASLGLENEDGTMRFVVERNSQIPTKRTIIHHLSPLSKIILVYEGEKYIAEDNLLLGELQFPSAASSLSDETRELEISFYVDMNNVVMVTAKDTKSGIDIRETFSDSKGRLSTNEIAKMIHENEKISFNQKEAQEKKRTWNELEKYINSLMIKLKDKNVEVNLGGFVYDKLNAVARNAYFWLHGEGKKAEVEDILTKKKDIEFLFQIFRKDIGL